MPSLNEEELILRDQLIAARSRYREQVKDNIIIKQRWEILSLLKDAQPR